VTRRLIVVDIETTGLNPGGHQILELCAIDLTAKDSEIYMAPHVSVTAIGSADYEALAINRYFERRVPQSMLSPEETTSSYDRLREILDGNTFGGCNPTFDAAFVSRKTSAVWHHRLADLSAYAAAALRLAPNELVGLDDICSRLGVVNEDPHSARGDARATAECFRRLYGRYDFGPQMPWEPKSLRHESKIVATEDPRGTTMTDVVERAEAALKFDREHCGWRPYVIELLAELKAARAQRDSLQELNNNQANLLTEAAERLGDARAENERLTRRLVGIPKGEGEY
jgi:DNA polymerase-3 subunit epsilon